MSFARSTLLWISANPTLRRELPKLRFIRNAVTRFMPGEELSDAIAAAKKLQKENIDTIFTHLGENITEEQESRDVTDHYIHQLRQIHANGLDTYASVKLTQLGLDISDDLCLTNLKAIARTAKEVNTMVWIDIEQSHYVDRTIMIYRRAHAEFSNIGLCLQAYLMRTYKDLEELIPISPAVRLVKGAYKEPPNIAFHNKSDVDRNFFILSRMMLENVKAHRVFPGIATHDQELIRAITAEADRLGLSKNDYEFQLLYGIQMQEQRRLAEEGYRIRCLISYGSFWFPWYVRRLAERPANVWFVLKNIFS